MGRNSSGIRNLHTTRQSRTGPGFTEPIQGPKEPS